MRRAFLLPGALVTSMVTFYAAAAGPAAADPANASSASAYGLSASGLVAIAPTITTQAAFPPGEDNGASGDLGAPSPTLVTLPLGTLALAGVVGVTANAHLADDVTPELSNLPACSAPDCEPVTLAPVNARGLAKTTGVGLLFTAPTTGPVDPIATLLQQLGGLLTADAVTSEAVARCVNGQPVFDTGFQVTGLGGLVGGVVDPVVQAILDLLLNLLGPGATLSSVISIAPGVVTNLPDGVAVDGLQVSIPILDESLVISHSEAHMAPDCAVVIPPIPLIPIDGMPVALAVAAAVGVVAMVARRRRRDAVVVDQV